MKLERLALENFRQFKGRQELVFSDFDERNVTLVHAENGFGKTTLLKALLWALYGRKGLLGFGEHDQDFEKPDSIVHEGLALSAADPSQLFAKVELTFTHEGGCYTLTRQVSLAQQRLDPKQTTLSLAVLREGQTYDLPTPQPHIQAIVPDGISKLLFFNGERINYLAAERNSKQVTDAIHQMLGLTLLQCTISDLRHQSVRGKLRVELRDCASDEKSALIERQQQLEMKVTDQQEQRATIGKNLKAIADEIAAIDNKLAANREAAALQQRRQSLKQQREALITRRDAIQQQLCKLIAEDGYTLFTGDLIGRGEAVVARLRQEGKIPAKVLNTFLDELLEQGVCICGRPLTADSPERAKVENLLEVAGDQAFNNAVGALDHAIGHIKGIAAKTSDALRHLNAERLELKRQIDNCEQEIEEIHQKLGGKDDDEVQQLEQQRRDLELKENGLHGEDGRIRGAIDTAETEMKTLAAQISQLEDQEEAAARAQRRLDAVDQCSALLERILDAETQGLRPLLNDEIDRHFRRIMTKDYWAELTEDYTLRIRKKVAPSDPDAADQITDVALSTGERTVTSLVFIASLVSLARKRSEIPTILKGLSGATYPVAIDSPFGSLSIFREGVARDIPELAPQVLLLVSPEQYNGAVEKALNASGRVGRRYYLVYHGPSIPQRASSPDLIVNGQRLQQYVANNRDEYTEIVSL